MRCMTSLPGASWGCALPATTIWTGSASSRSRSEKTSPARLYVAKRRAKPIVRRSGSSAAQTSEPLLELGVHVPERLGVELEHGVPAAVGGRRLGAYADRAQELVELRREPRAEVHAVRDVADRRLRARPQPGPHLARNLAVQLRDAVRVGREPERQRRQAEAVGAAAAARARAARRPEMPACAARPPA